MSLNIAEIRRQTPGVAHGAHLLACGAALMPQAVVDAVVAHTRLEAQLGGYEAHAARYEALEAVYDDVAGLIGAQTHEIALVENATVAWWAAFYALRLGPGDVILTAQAEYASNYLAFLHRARRDGVEVRVIPSDDTGAVDVAALAAMLDDRVKLIAVTWVPTNGGMVNPAAQIGAVARRAGVPYLLDACQAVGQMPVDVGALRCDFLSATGRKFLRGPRGTGFLYVAEKWLSGPDQLKPAMIDLYCANWTGRDSYTLRADARRFENWENAYALRAGLGEAVRLARGLGLENIQRHAWGLADRLRAGLSGLPGITLRDGGHEQAAIVSFSHATADPQHLTDMLKDKGFVIGTSTPASTLLDAEARDLPTLLRAAPHTYNTEAEIDLFIEALAALIS